MVKKLLGNARGIAKAGQPAKNEYSKIEEQNHKELIQKYKDILAKNDRQ